MAGNDKQQSNIEQARELLSPYLDGEVSGEERGLVEEALAVSDELRADLDTLRQTVSLLQALPSVPAPRPFTLSEADVGLSAPAAGGRGFFGLPAWLAGLAAAAAALVCVLAVGGLFLAGQSGGLSAPAELAGLNKEAASQAVQTESEPVEEAAEAPAAEAEIAPQAAAPAEPPAPAPEEKLAAEAAGEEATVEAAEPEVSREEAQAVEVEAMEETEEPAADEAAEDTLSAVGEAAEAEAGQAEADGELYRDDEADTDAAAGAASLPTPTPAPLSTPEQPALAEEVMPAEAPAVEEESLAAAPAPTAEVPANLAESAEGAPPPAAAEASQEQNLAQRGVAPRLVEIRDQYLSIRPGLIRLEGVIEVEPETVLQATLLRNGAPFDTWAASPVLQTVVQPGGRFTFEFEAVAGSADRDLFALEPANYQIIISSMGLDEPVTATVFFDTFGPSATAEPPTGTPSPPATPTAMAKAEVTFEPSPPASPVVTPVEVPVLSTPTVAPTQAGPVRSLTLILVVAIVGLGGLTIAGFLLWWLLKKQQR